MNYNILLYLIILIRFSLDCLKLSSVIYLTVSIEDTTYFTIDIGENLYKLVPEYRIQGDKFEGINVTKNFELFDICYTSYSRNKSSYLAELWIGFFMSNSSLLFFFAFNLTNYLKSLWETLKEDCGGNFIKTLFSFTFIFTYWTLQFLLDGLFVYFLNLNELPVLCFWDVLISMSFLLCLPIIGYIGIIIVTKSNEMENKDDSSIVKQ